MFKGKFTFVLDKKGRFVMPAPIRKTLKEEEIDKFTITIGNDGCLIIYPLDKWKEVAERLLKNETLDPASRAQIRSFIGNAWDCEMDSQYRITIPLHLREIAHLEVDKEIVLIGIGRSIEIWNPDILAEHEKQARPVDMNLWV
jgi:MraZ protein